MATFPNRHHAGAHRRSFRDPYALRSWTVGNRINAENYAVGLSTGSRGIVGGVARACRDQFSVLVFQIEKQVCGRMRTEER